MSTIQPKSYFSATDLRNIREAVAGPSPFKSVAKESAQVDDGKKDVFIMAPEGGGLFRSAESVNTNVAESLQENGVQVTEKFEDVGVAARVSAEKAEELNASAALSLADRGYVLEVGQIMFSDTGKALLVGLLSTPMVVPVVVTAAAVYFAFALVGLNNTLIGLVLAHTVLSVPYVLITVLATLQTFDRNLLKAAATLGAPPHVAFVRVVLPSIAPGVATGALFAFATSFDELIVALFVASPAQFTLPRQMFAGLREFLSPTIAAAAVLLIGCSLVLLALNEWVRARATARTRSTAAAAARG